MTILDPRPPVLTPTPLRTPESVWADVVAACAMADSVADLSGESVPAPDSSEPTYTQGTAAFACACPRCMAYGPDRRA
jgi:hypothetical protein